MTREPCNFMESPGTIVGLEPVLGHSDHSISIERLMQKTWQLLIPADEVQRSLQALARFLANDGQQLTCSRSASSQLERRGRVSDVTTVLAFAGARMEPWSRVIGCLVTDGDPPTRRGPAREIAHGHEPAHVKIRQGIEADDLW